MTSRSTTVVLALLLCCLCTPEVVSQQTASEEKVKAAFVYNFAKFVTWPGNSFAGRAAPFRIAILGSSGIRQELDLAVNGKSIQGRAISVSSSHDLRRFDGAQILYIPADYDISESEIALLHAAHVLTVGESKEFLKRGGIIRFYLSANKVHFEINPKAAAVAGLEISSKLIRVARLVTTP